MESQRLLLDIWQEACKHIEIGDFARTVRPILSRLFPLGSLLIRRFDRSHRTVLTVAMSSNTSTDTATEDRQSLSIDETEQLARWIANSRVLRRGKRLTGHLGLILPEHIKSDVLAIPLLTDNQPLGVLLLVASHGLSFSDSEESLSEKLIEPFATALANDTRVEEIAALRQAAEADKGALLRRLGRTEISDGIVGEHQGLRPVMERVSLVAISDVPVLLLGETGTGKEVIARAVHNRSDRHDGPFIRVNCGAIPRELIDSQLFGHEKGSFTGADQTRQGWFERADGGTLFLDEIGELPLEAQVRFLRVLQDGFVERVGGANPIHVNVRIIAATHRDLSTMVADHQFREDLWYRLAVFPILIPPLRERLGDIPALAEHFASRASVRFGLAPVKPADSDILQLQSYTWPGNIRELGAVIDRAAILGEGRSLEIGKSLGINQPVRTATKPVFTTGYDLRPLNNSRDVISVDPGHILTLDDAMKAHIEKVLQITEGRIEGRKGAAAILGINPHTLRARMRKLNLEWSRFRTASN
ncbi:sigma-54 interaction domain-containing protein [Lacunimicrobium album]